MQNHTTKHILKAINKTIQIMEQPKANGKNPRFGNTYIELKDINKALKPAILEAGLTIIKNTEDDFENQRYGVQITLVHIESGESIEYKTVWRYYDKKNPQAQMAAETYATRQALCNCFMIAIDEDCDGNGASPEPTKKIATRATRIDSKQQKTTGNSLGAWNNLADENQKRDNAQRHLMIMCRKKGISDEVRRAVIKELTGKKSATELNIEQLRQVYTVINKYPISWLETVV